MIQCLIYDLVDVFGITYAFYCDAWFTDFLLGRPSVFTPIQERDYV